MANPRRMISRSLASTVSPGAEMERYGELSGHSQSLRRASMLALHACAVKLPRATAALTGIRYKDWDAEFIGEGFEFSVFRTSEDEVLKIAHRTIDMRRSDQESYAAGRQAQYNLMAQWLGEFSLPQRATVEPLPFLPSQTAVQVRQPYKSIIDPKIFVTNNPSVDPENLAAFMNGHPTGGDQLCDFIERGQSLYKAHELLPDTNGSGNLVLNGENVVMVDGQPIGTEHRPVQEIILGQLDSLQFAMAG